MRKGDVCIIDYEPATGAEPNKRRPSVVISNDVLNAVTERKLYGVITVAPLTSNIDHVGEHQVLVPNDVSGLKYDSKLQVELLRSVDFRKIKSDVISHLPDRYMDQVDAAIAYHFGLFF